MCDTDCMLQLYNWFGFEGFFLYSLNNDHDTRIFTCLLYLITQVKFSVSYTHTLNNLACIYDYMYFASKLLLNVCLPGLYLRVFLPPVLLVALGASSSSLMKESLYS